MSKRAIAKIVSLLLIPSFFASDIAFAANIRDALAPYSGLELANGKDEENPVLAARQNKVRALVKAKMAESLARAMYGRLKKHNDISAEVIRQTVAADVKNWSVMRQAASGSSITVKRFRGADKEIDKGNTFVIATGGGDCAGLNPAIAAFIREMQKEGKNVLGVKEGYKGVASPEFLKKYAVLLENEDAGHIQGLASTVLASSRENPYEIDAAGELKDPNRIENCRKNLDGFAGFAIIGGEDNMGVAGQFSTDEKLPKQVAAIPKSIDNDVDTQMLGFHTAWTEARDIFYAPRLEGAMAQAEKEFDEIIERFVSTAVSADAHKKYNVTLAQGDQAKKAGAWLANFIHSANPNADPIFQRLPAPLKIHLLHLRDSIVVLTPDEPRSLKDIVATSYNIYKKKRTANVLLVDGFVFGKDEDGYTKEAIAKDHLLKALYEGQEPPYAPDFIEHKAHLVRRGMIYHLAKLPHANVKGGQDVRFSMVGRMDVSRSKYSVTEIMGRKAGWLALYAGSKYPKDFEELPIELQKAVEEKRAHVLILTPEKPATLKEIVDEAGRIWKDTGRCDILVAEGLSFSKDDEYLKKLLENNKVLNAYYDEQVVHPAYDSHGHPKLEGIGWFVRWAISHFLHEELAYIPEWKMSYELRGLAPDEYDTRLGEAFGRKAAELLLSGSSGKAVTLPDGLEPIYENIQVRPIADAVRQKNITTQVERGLLTEEELRRQGVFQNLRRAASGSANVERFKREREIIKNILKAQNISLPAGISAGEVLSMLEFADAKGHVAIVALDQGTLIQWVDPKADKKDPSQESIDKGTVVRLTIMYYLANGMRAKNRRVGFLLDKPALQAISNEGSEGARAAKLIARGTLPPDFMDVIKDMPLVAQIEEARGERGVAKGVYYTAKKRDGNFSVEEAVKLGSRLIKSNVFFYCGGELTEEEKEFNKKQWEFIGEVAKECREFGIGYVSELLYLVPPEMLTRHNTDEKSYRATPEFMNAHKAATIIAAERMLKIPGLTLAKSAHPYPGEAGWKSVSPAERKEALKQVANVAGNRWLILSADEPWETFRLKVEEAAIYGQMAGILVGRSPIKNITQKVTIDGKNIDMLKPDDAVKDILQTEGVEKLLELLGYIDNAPANVWRGLGFGDNFHPQAIKDQLDYARYSGSGFTYVYTPEDLIGDPDVVKGPEQGYSWAGYGISAFFGLAKRLIAEIWYHSVQKDGLSKVPGATHDKLREDIEGEKSVFAKIMGKDETQPQVVHIGFNEKIGPGGEQKQLFVDLCVRERRLVKRLKRELEKYIHTEAEFVRYQKAYAAWVSRQSAIGVKWTNPGLPELPEFMAGFDMPIFEAIQNVRAEIVRYFNEIELKPGQFIRSPVGFIHSIVGSYQGHPLSGKKAKNEAWYIFSIGKDAEGHDRLLYFEPQQTSNTTYSPLDFPTPIVWKNGGAEMRKDIGAGIDKDIDELLQDGDSTPANDEDAVKVIAERAFYYRPANPDEFVVNSFENVTSGGLYAYPKNARAESLIEGKNAYPNWPEDLFTLHRIILVGDSKKKEYALITVRPPPEAYRFDEFFVIKGKVKARIGGQWYPQVLAPGASILVTDPRSQIEIRAEGEAEVLRLYHTKQGPSPRLAKAGEAVGTSKAAEWVKLIKDPNSSEGIRRKAADDLGLIESVPEEAVTSLIEMLDSEDKGVLKYVVMALGNIRVKRVVQGLVDMLSQEDFDMEVRIELIIALGKIGERMSDDSQIRAALENILKNLSQIDLNHAARYTLTNMDAAKKMAELLKDRTSANGTDLQQETAEEDVETKVAGWNKIDADSLLGTLAAIRVRNGQLRKGPILIAYDTGLEEFPTGHVAQAADAKINEYLDGGLVSVRGTGEKLLEAIKEVVAAKGLNPKDVVVIAGDNTAEAARKFGTVIHVKNTDGQFLPIIEFYNLALKILYGLGEDEILESLKRIGGAESFTTEDVRKLFSAGIIRILPKTFPIRHADAVEAYRATRRALESL